MNKPALLPNIASTPLAETARSRQLLPIEQSEQDIGQNLGRLRKQAKMSQAELARRVGVALGTVSSWESGRLTGARRRLQQLAQILKVPTEQLALLLNCEDEMQDEDINTSGPSRIIGERIRLLRKSRGMSRAELAKHVGVSTVAIGFWETGRPGDAQKHLKAIAQALGVSVETLLTGNCEKQFEEIISQDEHIMLTLYRRLDCTNKIYLQRRAENILLKPRFVGTSVNS